jgi:peptidoglycan/LPS O-acetylase OafA/YrhL
MPQLSKLSYRPDIDGLRGIAIVAVILFHLSPHDLFSGLMGVDIFFVISGYLITFIILNDLKNETFSFIHFYQRRIIRLFPGLIFLFATILIFGWFVALPIEYANFGKHVRSGALYISNFTLLQETSYFAMGLKTKPLLHLWSLAVEEQYYLIFPAIIYFCRKNFSLMSGCMIFLTLLSFSLNLYYVSIAPAEAYYMPYTRVWQILVGSILALYEFNGHKKLSKSMSLAASLIGIVLIISAFIIMSWPKTYPGAWALLPSLGTALIIAAGADNPLNKKILANPLLVGIGLISYPLYLWHWPLLYFSEILAADYMNIKQSLIPILISVLLAFLTYVFFEKPIKKRGVKSRGNTAGILFIFIVALGFTGFAVEKNWIPGKPLSAEAAKIQTAMEDWNFPGKMRKVKKDHVTYYEMGSTPAKVLFLGDSHMEQFSPRVEKVLEETKEAKSVVFMTKGGCLPLSDMTRNPVDPICQKIYDLALERAMDPNIETVVIGAAWHMYFNDHTIYFHKGQLLKLDSQGYKLAFDSLKHLIQDLKKNGKKVHLLLSLPLGTMYDPYKMIIRNTSLEPFKVQFHMFNREIFLKNESKVLNDLKIAGEEAGAKVHDLLAYICDRPECPVVTPTGEPLYSDYSHVRPFYAREKLTFIDELLLQPE